MGRTKPGEMLAGAMAQLSRKKIPGLEWPGVLALHVRGHNALAMKQHRLTLNAMEEPQSHAASLPVCGLLGKGSIPADRCRAGPYLLLRALSDWRCPRCSSPCILTWTVASSSCL